MAPFCGQRYAIKASTTLTPVDGLGFHYSALIFHSFTLQGFYCSFQPLFYVRLPEPLSLLFPDKDSDTVQYCPKKEKFLLIKLFDISVLKLKSGY